MTHSMLVSRYSIRAVWLAASGLFSLSCVHGLCATTAAPRMLATGAVCATALRVQRMPPVARTVDNRPKFSWHFGDGMNTGTPAAMAHVPLGSATNDRTRGIAIGDVTGDGWPDIVVGNYADQNYVLVNDGSGNPATFSRVNLGSATSDYTCSLAIGDVTSDGRPDVVVGNNGEQNCVLVNNGSGDPSTFPRVDLGSPLADITYAVALADMTGDGHLDVVVGNNGEQNYVVVNNGSGDPATFARVNLGTALADETCCLAVGDITGDRLPDIVVGNQGISAQNYVLVNDGSGNPSLFTRTDLGSALYDNTWGVAVGDVTGDAEPDVVVGNDGEPSYVLVNNHSGDPASFARTTLDGGSSEWTRSIMVGDLTGDGLQDIIACNYNSGPSVVLANNASGDPATFPRISLGAPTNMPTWIAALGDITGDGRLDVAMGNSFAHNVVLVNAASAMQYSQASYRLQVSTSSNDWSSSLVWDSGLTSSPRVGDGVSTVQAGLALTNSSTYYWRVQVASTRGPQGGWDGPQRFVVSGPSIFITSMPANVRYDMLTCSVAGTNSLDIAGSLRWSNMVNHASGTVPAAGGYFLASGIPLVFGTNSIRVVGSNVFGTVAADAVVVTRAADITPFLDITNTDVAVHTAVASVSIGGTNNHHVVGTMWISNAANGLVATLAASTKWRALGIPLVYGTNEVHAYGTNTAGIAAHDSVRIVRHMPGTPYIRITNAPHAVQAPLSALRVSGTNDNIVGRMAWIDSTHRTNWFAATSPGWSVILADLMKGSNSMTIIGTNGFGVWAQDTVVIIGTNPWHALQTIVSGLGAVTLSPPGGVYEHGTVVTMAALPGLDHVFAGWSGNAAGSALTTVVAMTGAKTVTATFEPLPPTIVSFAINGGNVLTTNRLVALDSICTNSPTHFIASELQSFSNATWRAYAPSAVFMIGSAGTGTKTVYFKARNAAGETARMQDTIYYNESVVLSDTGFYMRLVEQDITVGDLFHVELYSSLTQTWDYLCQHVRRSGASQGRFLILDAEPGGIVGTSLFHAVTGPSLDSIKFVTWSNMVVRPDNGILAHLTCYADSPGRTRISYVAMPGSTFVSNTCALALDTDILASPDNHLDGMADLDFSIAPPRDGVQMSLQIDRSLADTGEYVSVLVNLNHSRTSWFDRASILLEFDSTVLALSNVSFGLSPDTTEITVNPDGRSNTVHIAAGWDSATLSEGEFARIGFLVTNYGNCKISLLPPDVSNETWATGTTVTRVGFDVLGSGATWLDVPSPVWLMCVWPGSYALVAETSEETPCVGDEIEIDVSAHAAGPGTIDAVGFSLDYDATLLELMGCMPNDDELGACHWQHSAPAIWLTGVVEEAVDPRDIDVATLAFRVLRPGTARIGFRFLPPPAAFGPGSTYALRTGNDILGSPFNPTDGVAGCSLSIAAVEGDGDAVLSIQSDSMAARGACYDAYLVGTTNAAIDPSYLEAHVAWDPDVFSCAGVSMPDPGLSLTSSLDAASGILALYGPTLLSQCVGTIAVVRLRAIDSGDTTIELIPPETSAETGTRLLDAYGNDLLGSLDNPEDGMVESDVCVMDAEAYILELSSTNETVVPGVPFFLDVVLTNACNGFFYTNIGVLVEYNPDDVMVLAVSNVGLGNPNASATFCTVTNGVGYCGISCTWASPTNAVGVLARVWAMSISDWNAEFAFSFSDQAYAYPGTFVLDADLDVLGEQDFEEDGVGEELDIPNAGVELGAELCLPSWPPLAVGDRSAGSIVLSNYSSVLCSEINVVLQYDKEYMEVEAISTGTLGGTVVEARIDHGEGIVTYHEVFATPQAVAGEVCRIDIFARRDGEGALWLVPVSEDLEADGTFGRYHQLDVLGSYDDWEDGGADAESWIEIASNSFPSLWLDDYNLLEMSRGYMVYATPLEDYLANRDPASDSLVWSVECVEGPKPDLAVIPPLPPYTALIYPQTSFVGTQLFKIAVCDAANPSRSSYDYIQVVYDDEDDSYQPAGIVTSQVALGASMFLDADGDTWSYSYVSESGICTYSTGVFSIAGGGDDDILAITVTKVGDGAVNFEAIETDGGFDKLVLQGSLNRLDAAGALGTISIKSGNLGNVRAQSLKKLSIITPLWLAGTEDAFTTLADIPQGLVGSVETEGSIGSISVRGGDVGSLNDFGDYGQTIRSRTGSIGVLTARGAKRSYGSGEDKCSYLAGGSIYAHVLAPSGAIAKVSALGGNVGWDNVDRPARIHAGVAIGQVTLKWPKMADEYPPGLYATIITPGSVRSVTAISADIGTDYLQTCIACSELKTLRALQWKHSYNDDGPWTDFYGGNLYVNVLASGSVGSVVGSGEYFMPCVIAAGDIKQVKSVLSKDCDKEVFGGIMDGARVAAGLTTAGARSLGSLKSVSAGADIFNSVLQGGCAYADRRSGYLGSVGSIKTGGELSDSVVSSGIMPKLKLKGTVSGTTYYINGARQ